MQRNRNGGLSNKEVKSLKQQFAKLTTQNNQIKQQVNSIKNQHIRLANQSIGGKMNNTRRKPLPANIRAAILRKAQQIKAQRLRAAPPKPQRTRNLTTGSTVFNNMSNVAKTNKLTSTPSSLNMTASSDFNYIKCRIDPFDTNSMSSMGIPDADGSRKIVIDYRQYNDLTFTTGGTVELLSMPMLPCSMFMKSSTTIAGTMNAAYGTTQAILSTGTQTQGWQPVIEYQEFATYALTNPVNVANKPVLIQNPYWATRSRIVTMCTKIYYTGPIMSTAGTLTASDVDFTTERGSITLNPNLITQTSVSGGTTPAVTTNTFAATTVNQCNITLNTNSGLIRNDTVMLRPEAGGVLLPKHRGTQYSWREVFASPMYFINTGESAATGNTNTMFGYSYAAGYGGTMLWDEDWSGQLITIAGIQAGHSYRIEQIFCVEFQLQIGSPFDRLTVKSQGMDKAIKIASKVAEEIPTMIPLAVGLEPWYIKAARIAAKLGKTIFDQL